MWSKLIFGVCSYCIVLTILLLHHGSVAGFLLLYALFGAVQAYILINIGHDASHDALTHNRFANQLLRASLDMCGLDSRLFAKSHVELHHARVNIGCEDEATRARGVLRLSPHMPRPWWGKIQHVLVWPAYSLGSLDFIFLRDWEMISRQPNALRHLIIGKSLYLGATIGLPFWFTPHGFGIVLTGWIISHLIIGLTVMLTLQITHLVDDSEFPATLEGSAMNPRHIMATTMDMATQSKILALLAGGLHQHVAHHLYPGMCHVHYSAVTRIIVQTAEECGLTYRCHPRFVDAVSAHIRLLKKLGRSDQPASQG